jgi:hypothetical protein
MMTDDRWTGSNPADARQWLERRGVVLNDEDQANDGWKNIVFKELGDRRWRNIEYGPHETDATVTAEADKHYAPGSSQHVIALGDTADSALVLLLAMAISHDEARGAI